MNSTYLKKRPKALWLGFLLLILVGTVHAQNCPEGMVPEGGQGVASCAPSGSDDQSQGYWVDHWGAIATDDPQNTGGAAVNQSSEDRAKQAAIANCVDNGGSNCKIIMTYVNMCVALVAGDRGHSVARANTIEKAVQLGMEQCVAGGDTHCQARYRSCSAPPQWIQ